jgi:hypothetical protein
LVKAEFEEGLESGLLGATASLTADQPVESGGPPDDAEDEFQAESSIICRQRVALESAIEQHLGEFALVEAFGQEAKGNFSWFLKAHYLIMNATQSDARF